MNLLAIIIFLIIASLAEAFEFLVMQPILWLLAKGRRVLVLLYARWLLFIRKFKKHGPQLPRP